MEKRRNKFYSNLIFYAVIVVPSLYSCHGGESYMDLLTDGDIKYWQNEKTNYYVSFDRKTLKVLHHTPDLYVDYINGIDLMAKGQSFKIKKDTLYTFWIIKKHDIITPIDTFIIKSISKNVLELASKNDSTFSKFIFYPIPQKCLRTMKINPIQQWGYKQPEPILVQECIGSLIDNLCNYFEKKNIPFPKNFDIKVILQVDKEGKTKNVRIHDVQPSEDKYSHFYNEILKKLKEEMKFIPAHNSETGEYFDSENLMLPIHYRRDSI